MREDLQQLNNAFETMKIRMDERLKQHRKLGEVISVASQQPDDLEERERLLADRETRLIDRMNLLEDRELTLLENEHQLAAGRKELEDKEKKWADMALNVQRLVGHLQPTCNFSAGFGSQEESHGDTYDSRATEKHRLSSHGEFLPQKRREVCDEDDKDAHEDIVARTALISVGPSPNSLVASSTSKSEDQSNDLDGKDQQGDPQHQAVRRRSSRVSIPVDHAVQ